MATFDGKHRRSATHLSSAENHTSMIACRSGGISFKPACAGAGISGKKSDGSVLRKSSKSTSAMTPCHTILHQTRPNRITTSCHENCPSMSNSRLHALKLVHQLHHAFCKPSLSSAGVSKPSPILSTFQQHVGYGSSAANQRCKNVSPRQYSSISQISQMDSLQEPLSPYSNEGVVRVKKNSPRPPLYGQKYDH